MSSFLPDDATRSISGVSMAPMIDFLFLMLVFFATLAVSRVTTRDTNIDLVEIRPEVGASLTANDAEQRTVTLKIAADGAYAWVAELRDYPLDSPVAVTEELQRQYQKGILPEDPKKTFVMLKIDKTASWDAVMRMVFAVRDAGFEAHPVYLPEEAL
ncbi:MAG: biopolymer transporter ExbD [Chlamydiia bacterium]|nr:biopolymer transporter ExbD [Chlamydiia bacterium]